MIAWSKFMLPSAAETVDCEMPWAAASCLTPSSQCSKLGVLFRHGTANAWVATAAIPSAAGMVKRSFFNMLDPQPLVFGQSALAIAAVNPHREQFELLPRLVAGLWPEKGRVRRGQ